MLYDGATATGTLFDDAKTSVDLPFSFRFYGVPLTSLTLSVNGFVTFNLFSGTGIINAPIPDSDQRMG